MSLIEFGIKPPSVSGSLAALDNTRTTIRTDYTDISSDISGVHLVADGDTLKQIFAGGRATTSGVDGTGQYGLYVTDITGITTGALVTSDILITTSSPTVAWYSSADNLGFDLSPWDGQYVKVAVGPDSGWRRAFFSSTASMTSVDRDFPSPFGSGTTQNTAYAMYAVVDRPGTGPRINPTGTDTTLTVGATHSIAFAGITSNPVSVAVLRDGVVAAQADFALGETDELGNAEGSFTATIGSLPYTDTTYLSSEYSYLVVCEDDSELTLSGVSIAPASGRNFVTAAAPVNDSTSIIHEWVEGEAATGDQLDYPTLINPVYNGGELVEGVYLNVRPDFTFYGTAVNEFPELVEFTVGYWDNDTHTRYAVDIEVDFNGEDPDDTTPDPFEIPQRSNVRPDTLTVSSSFTITGEFTSATASITEGEYSVNGGEWTSDDSQIVPNDVIQVRLTSSPDWETAVSTTFTVGDQSSDFVITTRAEPVVGEATNKIQTFWMR